MAPDKTSAPRPDSALIKKHPMKEVRGVVAVSLEDAPLFMTPKQLVDATGEHEGSIRRGIAEDSIPADKANGRWRICREVIFPNASKEAGYGRPQNE